MNDLRTLSNNKQFYLFFEVVGDMSGRVNMTLEHDKKARV
jgi:hypothetical protein